MEVKLQGMFDRKFSSPGPAFKTFSCSSHLSMKFQMLIKIKMLKNKDVLAVVFILLINVNISTIV